LPRDPWGNDYQYADESQHQQDYDLSSLGPDRQPGNDDVTNWE
jgi:general secretion pathway protein G